MKYQNNVKPGDVLLTKIGTGIIVKQTRNSLQYLQKNRLHNVKKNMFWFQVDMGMMDIQYAEGKKYRRSQKSDRIFNVINIPDGKLEEEFHKFVVFANVPFRIAISEDEIGTKKTDFLFEKILNMNYNFSVTGNWRSGITFITVTKDVN